MLVLVIHQSRQARSYPEIEKPASKLRAPILTNPKMDTAIEGGITARKWRQQKTSLDIVYNGTSLPS